jgi:hypothetical protein
MEDQEMLSLYEYLGKAAGPDLGKKVYDAAKDAKINTTTQKVSNPKYTGKVVKYPKLFLDEYFSKQTPSQNIVNKIIIFDDNELPF